MKSIYLFIEKKLELPLPKLVKRECKLVIRYGLAGGTAATVQLALFFFITSLIGSQLYLVSSTIAFSAGLVVSFTLQKFWTFKDSSIQKMKKQFFIYGVMAVINILTNGVFMYLFVDIVGIWYLWAQVLTMGILAIISFIIHRTITFNNESLNHDRNFSS